MLKIVFDISSLLNIISEFVLVIDIVGLFISELIIESEIISLKLIIFVVSIFFIFSEFVSLFNSFWQVLLSSVYVPFGHDL